MARTQPAQRGQFGDLRHGIGLAGQPLGDDPPPPWGQTAAGLGLVLHPTGKGVGDFMEDHHPQRIEIGGMADARRAQFLHHPGEVVFDMAVAQVQAVQGQATGGDREQANLAQHRLGI